MSDPNAPHDPPVDAMDAAYVQAQAVLRDEAERAARRARVLGAVAAAATEKTPVEAKPVAAVAPPSRATGWRPAPWLMAAGVAGFAALIALRVTPPAVVRPPQLPESQPDAAAPGEAAPAPPIQGPTPQSIAPQAPAPNQPVAKAEPPRMRPQTERRPDVVPPPPLPIPPVQRRVEAPPTADVAPPSPMAIPAAPRRMEAPAPPPPPPPVPPVERRMPAPAPAPAPAMAGAAPQAARGRLSEEIVVTGQSIRGEPRVATDAAARAASDAGARLRAAAGAGRTSEIKQLLADGVPIDAPDADGRTALMIAVQARDLNAITLLRGAGADLDRRNRAGVSARRMAADRADPGIDRALGLIP